MTPDTGFRHFHDQLSTLKQRLLEMSQRAEELVELAVEALLTRDREKAEMVIAADREIDQFETDVEQLGIELLALQQPMARDLRFLISGIKVSSDLERVGDHAVNIAQSAIRLATIPATVTPSPEIEDMARRARKMLSDALDAFIRADGTIARYLHMKRGTVTTRPVGASIAAGEVLGKVGSSGISKVPHLHFELRASNSAGAPVIEPHAGTCNAIASAWAAQPPYRQPQLTRLSTHSRTPHYPTCPDTIEKPYLSDAFDPGATVTVVAAFRDARVGDVTTFRVVDPYGAVVSVPISVVER